MGENPTPPAETVPVPKPLEPLSRSEENTWAAIAHFSVLANLVTGFLGPLVAILIYFIFRDRSRYVAYQAMQSFLFQMIFWIGGGLIIGLVWTIVGLLSIILVGLILIPLACLLSLAPLFALGYGIVGGIQTAQGDDFRYWLVGDWVREIYTGV